MTDQATRDMIKKSMEKFRNELLGGALSNKLSDLMFSYCLMDEHDYPGYEEARDFFLSSFHWTAICRHASAMPPAEAAEYIYNELLADKYPRSEFPDLVETTQDMIYMSLVKPVTYYESEARRILFENGDLT